MKMFSEVWTCVECGKQEIALKSSPIPSPHPVFLCNDCKKRRDEVLEYVKAHIYDSDRDGWDTNESNWKSEFTTNHDKDVGE